MVVLDVDVYDMHRFIELAAAVKQIWLFGLEVGSKETGVALTITNSIVTPLLTSDNDVGNLFTFLPPFRCQFDLPVPVKHLQQTTGRVSKRGECTTRKRVCFGRVQSCILGIQLLVNVVVGRAKGVDIWLVYRRTGQPYGRSSTCRDHSIAGLAVTSLVTVKLDWKQQHTIERYDPPLTDSATNPQQLNNVVSKMRCT